MYNYKFKLKYIIYIIILFSIITILLSSCTKQTSKKEVVLKPSSALITEETKATGYLFASRINKESKLLFADDGYVYIKGADSKAYFQQAKYEKVDNMFITASEIYFLSNDYKTLVMEKNNTTYMYDAE